ncbi:tetratricopeptide repeat protein, partial [Gracilibacillus sp. HCP3S3_G5_1]|uniref:tetratricopeptide repeat protein n=1 Tax=unclassified Gracilibacillus TaxID=2625209 RepID=UPI003F89CF28
FQMDGATFNSVFTFLALNRRYNKTENYDIIFATLVILFNLKKYEESIQCFNNCINMGEENRKYLILKGVGSFQALYYISLCQEKLNKKEAAIVSLINSLIIAPQYNETLEKLTVYLKEDKTLVFSYLKKHFHGDTLQSIYKIIQELGFKSDNING